MADRRQVLQAAALATAGVLVLPACSPDEPADTVPDPTPDDQQADELALVAAYDAALATAGGAVREQYQRIRDEHAAHLRALGWLVTSGPPSASPSARRAPSRRALARAERRATRSRTAAARRSADPERAQILALIAASEAQHAAVLESP